MTTVNEVSNDKTNVPDKLFFVLFWHIASLPRCMCKLVPNQCTSRLIIRITAAWVYANEQWRLCSYVSVHNDFAILDVHFWKLYKRQLSAHA